MSKKAKYTLKECEKSPIWMADARHPTIWYLFIQLQDCERRALAKLFHHRSEIPPPHASG